MSNEVKVVAATNNRSLNDVAMELTTLYISGHGVNVCTVENIQNAYKKFYATAMNAQSMGYEEVEEILGE